MVGAYSVFANRGIYVKPVMITRIEDKNGLALFEVIPETKDVLSEEVAYVTLKLMQGVTKHGSGARLRHAGLENTNYVYDKVITDYPYNFENPIAGKTGTTQNQSDGWFMGMVPNLLLCGLEVKTDQFILRKLLVKGTMALPIWAIYMKSLYENTELGVSSEDFLEPEITSIPVEWMNMIKILQK